MKKLRLFILPLCLAIIGVGLWGAGLFSFITAFRENGYALQAPGTTTVTITNAGEYSIWNQTTGIVDGQFKTFPDHTPPGMVIKVTKKPEGTQIPFRTGMHSSMEVNGTRRISVAALTIDAPGQYEVEISGLTEKRALFLEKSKWLHTFLIFMGAGLCGLVFILGAIGTGIYALMRLLDNKS
jgi:hypothetical protein